MVGTLCQKFSLENICVGTNSVICGRRLTGKSVLLSDILQSRKKSKIVIFASRYAAPSYKKYFPSNIIHDHYNPVVLKKLISAQQKHPDGELVVGFDDIAVNKDLWKDNYIRDIIRYGSSLGITAIFSVQYTGQLDDTFKRNIDYVFCFRDNIIDNQKMLYTEFGGMFSTFHDFKVVHDECIAEPYRCLVFDMKTPRKDPSQSVFWYKTIDLQPYVDNKESIKTNVSIISQVYDLFTHLWENEINIKKNNEQQIIDPPDNPPLMEEQHIHN